MANSEDMDDNAYFTVDEILQIPGMSLKRARISALLGENGVMKKKNKYYATAEEILSIFMDERRTLQQYMLNGSLEQYLQDQVALKRQTVSDPL